MSAIGLRFRAMLSGTRIHWTALIENPENITLGRKCVIDALCVLRGGANSGSRVVLGNGVQVRHGTYISAQQSEITIGDDTLIGHYAWIAGRGKISVGSNSMIGPHTVIVSSNHDYMNISRPYHNIPEIPDPIVLGTSVWVGAQCVVLPGVKIGNGSVVGAGSVVVKDIPSNSLAIGSPAKVIRTLERKGVVPVRN